MPAYFDKDKKKWYCKFYYKNWKGEQNPKFKRGFDTKKEALAWERNFLEKQQIDLNMSFENFIDIYKDDMSLRLRASTMSTKMYIVEDKLLPYFGKLPMNAIKAAEIRQWQNALLRAR